MLALDPPAPPPSRNSRALLTAPCPVLQLCPDPQPRPCRTLQPTAPALAFSRGGSGEEISA